MMIKVELFEGQAYALDEQGNIWQIRSVPYDHQVEIRSVTKLSREAVNTIMLPQLARFVPQ